MTRADITREYNGYCPEAEWLTRGESLLKAEVAEYDQFLIGDVYGFLLHDHEGETVASCWGYYGKAAVREATIEAAMYAEQEALPLLHLAGVIPTSDTTGGQRAPLYPPFLTQYINQ